MLLLMTFVSSKAQESIELTFTANTSQGSMYCPFDAVNVTNVTRGWTETLAYPDTVLVLNSTVGIGEQYGKALRLGEAYPNPFTDETNAPLEMPITGEVSIQVIRIDGTVVATSRNHLEAGSHRVKVSLSNPVMAFLVVTSTQGRQVVRMLCTKSGGRDSITVEPVSREFKPSYQLVRDNTTGEFQPGDMMRYTSVLFDGANTVYSNTVTQQQYESEIFTLLFDLTLPEVTTNQVTNITQTTATGVGNVTATGGVSVTERGICWSTSHNPTTSGSHASNGMGTGTYTVQMNGLTAGTTYYVRAYAINRFGTAYGSEVSFTTTQIPSYTINVSANPTNGGTVSGGGSYQQGQSCTVIATASNGYSFNNWTENGNVVSTNPNYTFIVYNNRSLVANFSVQAPNTYTINASPNPSNGGTVTGGGTYQQGQSCTVTATANTGYTFLRWTENGNQVSTNASYTFTVTGNRTLVAQFQLQSFTISASVTPSNSGTVTGGGSYDYGQTCTLMATANTGYVFEKWTKNGTQVSTEATYSFTVTESASYVAHFQLQDYTINVSANPANGGNVTGGGSYSFGQSCTVTATANTGYSFLRWTENGNQVSTNASYTFTVTGNRFLVAQFQTSATIPTVTTTQVTNITQTTAVGGGNVTSTGGANVTERGICWGTSHNPTTSGSHASSGTGTGSFTVSMTGLTDNTTYYVRAYAINSVGTAYGNELSFATLPNSGSEHDYVDLGLPSGLLWATCNVGANTPEDYGNHFAWAETQSKGDYSWDTYQYCNGTSNTLTKYCNNSNYGYNGFTDNLTTLLPEDDAATANWGNDWRTPTKEEWNELCNNTTHTWTIQNGVNGILFIASNGNSLFLPAAGYCTSSSPYSAGTYGYYWSNSLYTSNPSKAWTLYFTSDGYSVYYDFTRKTGYSVRAVRSEQPGTTYSITVSASHTNGGTVTGGGTYQQGQSCTVSATAASGYTFNNWTENGSVVSTNANYTFTVNSNRTLVAHFSAQAPNTYTINVSANPSNGGSVTGGGTYQQGQSCTITATANSGYIFLRWTENGNQVSTNANYTFTVTGNRTLVAQFQAQTQSYSINVSIYPTNGGSATGGGSYYYGQSCTVTATPATGYTFLWWREYGSVISTESSYTFTVTGDRNLLAQFSPPYYEIIPLANPTIGGTVSGGNIYQLGESCTVSATAATNYSFINWTENGNVVSTNANYTFIVNGSRTLVANFRINAPTGAIDGLFTINANGEQVYFSQGNLQYQASSSTWRFATNQYDVVGSANSNISQTYNGWIDLFGWGTSGFDHGAICYQPWSTSQVDSHYYAYGVFNYGLYEQSGQADWGYNRISNGGGIGVSQWRTLKDSEWGFVLFWRSTTSGILFAKAKVNNVNGVILLPDDWNSSHYSLNNTNIEEAPFSSNVINASTWTSSLEAYGAVFLPTGGWRLGTSISLGVDNYGNYWSSYCTSGGSARAMTFSNNTLSNEVSSSRAYGKSVRLVKDY